MILPIDERLRDEARRFRLAFGCPSCVWLDEARGACALGYPNDEHANEELDGRSTVTFCKAFELV